MVDAGQNLGAAYAIDINGVNQNSYGSGWEIGTHVYVGYSVYGGGTGLFFKLGGGASCEPPLYCGYTGTAVVKWPAVPNMGGLTKSGATVTDTSYPGGIASKVSRCTDTTIEPNSGYGYQSKSAGLGGSGDAEQLWNANSTMLHFNLSGGQGHLTVFNPATMVCGDPTTGYAITADKNLTNPGSSSVAYNFGSGSFDWTNPLIWYSFSSGVDATGVAVAKYSFNSVGQFTVTAPYVDFQYGLPQGTLVSAWHPNTTYASGQYVSYALNSTQAPDWQAGHSYNAGDVILPLANNPLGCGFKVSTAGTSSSSGTYEPVWSTAGESCTPASNGQLSEGSGGGATVKWRNLGGGPVFTLQLVSTGGTSGSASPFSSITHPDLLATYSDNGLTWENVGPMVPIEWTSFAGISSNSNRFCSAFSSNTYGNATKGYNTYNGDQGSGIFTACYDSSINTFELLNTATGFQSVVTCSGGTGSSCAGGTATMALEGSVTAITEGCPFPLHNLKGGSTLDYTVLTWQGAFSGTCGSDNLFGWEPFAPFNASTALQLYNSVSNHWTIGKSHLVNVGDQTVLGYGSGAYTALFNSSSPASIPTTTWQVGAPYTNPCDPNGTWYAGDPNPPCEFANAYDSHMAWWHDAADDDLGPICGSVYNYATLAPPPVAPWQGEEVCISSTPSWSVGGTIGDWQVWRFTHSFNTGGNPFFDTQFAISQLSNDGHFLAFSSDWNCTLGTITGGPSSGSSWFCGPPWVGGTEYTAGQMINPFGSTGGSGTNYGVFAVTVGGTSAATAPAWFVCSSGTAGSTITDANGVQYTCLGAGNGKGEVFVVQLTP
ncbi:MAG: hypothetical protein WAL56_22635 [Candidatus Sulfotelmatobacter sp.]